MQHFSNYAKNKEPIYFSDPIDQIEPIQNQRDYREASIKMLHIMNNALGFILKSEPKSVVAWQTAFAIGSSHCSGLTMDDAAIKCGVTKAHISKGARNFCKMTGIPPSFYMKKEESSESYSKARFKSILKNNPNSI